MTTSILSTTEINNQGFTGFSPGGLKGLWGSRPRSDGRELVISETADALSFAVLFGTQRRRFLSTAGQISPAQAELLRSAFTNMPKNSRIVLAMDNDLGGKKMVESITAAFGYIGSLKNRVTTFLPDAEGNDWE